MLGAWNDENDIAQMLCEVGIVASPALYPAGGPVSEWVWKPILGQVKVFGTQLANEAKRVNLGGAADGFNKTLTELSVTVST